MKTVGSVTVTGSKNGIATLNLPEGDLRMVATVGEISAVTVSGDGRSALIGSHLGEVVQVDVKSAVVVRRWTAPTGGQVTNVGWAMHSGRLLVRVASGQWWSPESCDACGEDGPLLDKLRRRISRCYRAENLQGITQVVRNQLGLRLCQKSPVAVEG